MIHENIEYEQVGSKYKCLSEDCKSSNKLYSVIRLNILLKHTSQQEKNRKPKQSRHKCLFVECKELHDFSDVGFYNHLQICYNGITNKKYAERFETNEWISCHECGKKFFFIQKRFKNEVVFTSAHIIVVVFIKTKNVKKTDFKTNESKERARLAGQKEKITKNKNSVENSEIYVQSSKNSWKTRRRNGNDIIGAIKAAEANRKNGNYSHEKSREKAIKGFETRKRNGDFGKRISKGEIAFSLYLDFFCSKDFFILWQSKIDSSDWLDIFGNLFEDFKSQLEPDFILIHKETLQPIIVCFDGIFIHGLDRQITEIAKKSLTSKFNKNIFNKYYSDRSFEEYSQKRNINLIRFDENSFGNFLFKNEPLIPYFTCGNSKVIDSVLQTFLDDRGSSK